MALRPDERVLEEEVKRNERFNQGLKTAGKAALQVGTTAAGFGLSSKILPFLSELIPADLALKGINKISPAVGSFLKKGMSNGLDLKEGFDFLKEKFQPKAEPAKQDRNIIQQYSPELFQFIDGKIKEGLSPLQAGAVASSQKQFQDVIKKMKKDHKADFADILQTVFGTAEQPQSQMQQPPQGQPQQGNVDAQLMAAFDKILKM